MENEQLHKQNKVVSYLLAFCLFLGITITLLNSLGGEDVERATKSLVQLCTYGVAIVVVILVLAIKKIGMKYIQYMIIIALGLITFILISSNSSTSIYPIVFLNLLIIGIYHNPKASFIMGLVGIVQTAYFYLNYRETMFPLTSSKGFMVLLAIGFMITIVATVQNKMGRNALKKIEESKKEEEKQKEKIEDTLKKTELAVENLEAFREELKRNLEQANQLSSELEESFNDISSGIQNQTKSVERIHQNIQTTKESIDENTLSIQEMKEETKTASKLSVETMEEVELLEKVFKEMTETVYMTVSLMEELSEKNTKIGDMIEFINRVSEQTNLLAINASIEAARAGEHGKGFAVVAQEVKGLADSVKKSTGEIAQLLTEIDRKEEELTANVGESENKMKKSEKVLEKVKETFRSIYHITEEEEKLASDINQKTERLKENSDRVAEEIQAIASISNQTSVSLMESLEHLYEQNRKIEQILSDFTELERKNKEMMNEMKR